MDELPTFPDVKSPIHLPGIYHENTVIDRKGRVRKIKPPTVTKAVRLQPINYGDNYSADSTTRVATVNSQNLNLKFSTSVINYTNTGGGVQEETSSVENEISKSFEYHEPPSPSGDGVHLGGGDSTGADDEDPIWKQRNWKEMGEFQCPSSEPRKLGFGKTDFYEERIFRDMMKYKEMLWNSSQLQWKPQRIQKQKVSGITDGVSSRNNDIWRKESDRDVYETEIENLEEEAEEEKEDMQGSNMSESLDSLVEKILESMNDGVIVDAEDETVLVKSSTWNNCGKSMKKSFSDEILERMDGKSETVNGHEETSRRSSKPKEKRNGEMKISENQVKRNEDDLEKTMTSHAERKQRCVDSVGSSGQEWASYAIPRTDIVRLIPSQPSVSSTMVVVADDASDRETSPEEIFEKIVESLRDTEGTYEEEEELFFSDDSLTKDGDIVPVNYSMENDWLSFRCNRISFGEDHKPCQSTSSATNSAGDSPGIFINTSMSSVSHSSRLTKSRLPPASSFPAEPTKTTQVKSQFSAQSTVTETDNKSSEEKLLETPFDSFKQKVTGSNEPRHFSNGSSSSERVLKETETGNRKEPEKENVELLSGNNLSTDVTTKRFSQQNDVQHETEVFYYGPKGHGLLDVPGTQEYADRSGKVFLLPNDRGEVLKLHTSNDPHNLEASSTGSGEKERFSNESLKCEEANALDHSREDEADISNTDFLLQGDTTDVKISHLNVEYLNPGRNQQKTAVKDDVPVGLRRPPRRLVKVLSDEVTSQTIYLKFAWPARTELECKKERKKEPFRELHLHRTIRMSDSDAIRTNDSDTVRMSDSDTMATSDSDTICMSEYDTKRMSDSGTDEDHKVCAPDENQSQIQTRGVSSGKPDVDWLSVDNRPEVIVEYENQEQTSNTEILENSDIDVTQTNSVKVLQVPAATVYKVQDLKEVVESVGKTMLIASKQLSTQLNVRVTCEAVQSKSCASMQNSNVTVIRNTILDTYTPVTALSQDLELQPEDDEEYFE